MQTRFQRFFLRVYKCFRALRPEETLSFCLTLFAIVTLAVLDGSDTYTPASILAEMIKYFSFGNGIFKVFFAAIWVLVVWKIYLTLNGVAVAYFINKQLLKNIAWKAMLADVFEPLRLLWPLALYALPLYGLLSVMGLHLQLNTKDVWLNGLDNAVFGFSPFIYFPSTFQNPTFEVLITNAYIYLQYVIMGCLVLLLLLKQITLLRRFIFCFLMSITLAFPFFAIVPCQDPNNFFIRNLRQHELSSSIQTELGNYAPTRRVKHVTQVIAKAETDTEHNNNVPISCFPSGHVQWSMFVVYFLAVLAPWTLIVSLPWIFFVMSGGVYFGQHYVVDYVLAVFVASLCIYLANRFITPKQHETTLPLQDS